MIQDITKSMNAQGVKMVISQIDSLHVWEEYEFLAEIAAGTFGKVIKVKQRFGYKQIRAIKQIQINPLSDEEQNEVMKLKALTNDHIVDYYGNIIENNELFIIMQHCTGNLRDQMKNYRQRDKSFKPAQVINIITQITSAMLTLTKQKILHLDLKPENILFIDENYYKLCDFGCSQLFQNLSKASYNRHGISSVSSENAAFGTPAYIAPEIQISNNSKPNNSCDAWALGVILYELIYHRHPIGLNKLGKVESSDFRKFIQGTLKIQFEPKLGYPIDILKGLLQSDRVKRKKWTELKEDLIKKYGRHESQFIDLEDAGKSQILLVVIFANIIITIEDNIENSANSFWKKHQRILIDIKNQLIKLGYLQMLKFNEMFQYKMEYKLKPKTFAQFKFMLEDMKEEAANIKYLPEKESSSMLDIENRLRKNLSEIRPAVQIQKQNSQFIKKLSVFIEEAQNAKQLFCNGHKFPNTCKIFQIEEKNS